MLVCPKPCFSISVFSKVGPPSKVICSLSMTHLSFMPASLWLLPFPRSALCQVNDSELRFHQYSQVWLLQSLLSWPWTRCPCKPGRAGHSNETHADSRTEPSSWPCVCCFKKKKKSGEEEVEEVARILVFFILLIYKNSVGCWKHRHRAIPLSKMKYSYTHMESMILFLKIQHMFIMTSRRPLLIAIKLLSYQFIWHI